MQNRPSSHKISQDLPETPALRFAHDHSTDRHRRRRVGPQGLERTLLGTESGRELSDAGYRDDVLFSAAPDAESVTPVLDEGSFRAGG